MKYAAVVVLLVALSLPGLVLGQEVTPTPEPTVVLVTATPIPTPTPDPVVEMRDYQRGSLVWDVFVGVGLLGLLTLGFLRVRQ